MANGDAGGQSPPYGPWTTFTAFVKELNGPVVPTVIDGSLFQGKSGTTQSELRGALKFFNLVTGERNETTPWFKEWVAASENKEAFTELLKDRVPAAYAEILEGLDLERGTRTQLEAAFRERGGLDGSANRKAVRFFLNAMVEAGAPLSPFFGADKARKSPTRNGARNGVRRAKKVAPAASATGDETVNGGGNGNGDPDGMERVTCSIPGGRTIYVNVPKNLRKAEEDFLLVFLRGYFDLKRPEEK